MATTVSPFTPKTSTPAPQVNLGGMLGSLVSKLKPPAQQAPAQTNQQAYNAAFPSLSKIGAANSLYQSTPQSIGVKAKAPEQNVQGPVTTIASTQQKTQPTVATGTTTQTPVSQPVVANNSGGTLNPNFNSQAPGAMANNGQPAQGSQPPAVSQGPYEANTGLYGQLIASMANRSAQPSQAYTDATGAYTNAVNNLSNFRRQVAGEQANISQQPIDLSFQQGRQQVLTQKASQEDAALQNAVNQQQTGISLANTQQGLQQQLLQQAAAGASPVQLSGGSYLQNPLGGGAADSQSGFQQGITNLTNLGIAQQNISQGQQYQGASQEVSNNLQLIAPVTNALSPYLAANSLDSNGVPFVNQQINKINSQANPVAYNTLTAAMGEIQNYAANMLGSLPGLTPTEQSSIVSSWASNMMNMTPQQLSAFSQNLEVLGQIRLAQLQSASQAGYGANSSVGTAAQGQNADTSQQLQSAGQNALNNLPDWAKAGAGLLLSTASGIANAASGEASTAIGSAAGTGLAAKVLGLTAK